jgi:hypothetical protein
MEMSEVNESDGGGYGKPPKSGQFKPGQSGNPAGRPRKKKTPRTQAYGDILTSIDRLILEEAKRLVRVREGDRVSEISQEHAVYRSAVTSALKGSPSAQRTVIAENQRVQELEMRHRKEVWDSWQSYVARWRNAAARAHANDRPAPDWLPHADDIEFEKDLSVYLRGPTNADELKAARRTADFRDLFLAMLVYSCDCKVGPPESHQHIHIWGLASHSFNAVLPPSLRLSADQLAAAGNGLVGLRRPKLEEHIGTLCDRVDWTMKIALSLARGRSRIDMRSLGLERVAGTIIRRRRVSTAKLSEELWAGQTFQNLTAATFDLLESNGLGGPPLWMAKARAAIAAREGAE